MPRPDTVKLSSPPRQSQDIRTSRFGKERRYLVKKGFEDDNYRLPMDEDDFMT